MQAALGRAFSTAGRTDPSRPRSASRSFACASASRSFAGASASGSLSQGPSRAAPPRENRHIKMEKPKTDDRAYKSLVLPNGIRAVLVQDPDEQSALGACCVNVNIGYMSDPRDIMGLAHFCEHMVHLGTAQYPVENSYKAFLAEHGGASNAVTSMEHTAFHLTVLHDHLAPALDQLASFFKDPLMTQDAAGREVNAVHAEYSRNLVSDARLIMQLRRHTADPTHPYTKFSTGNIETLKSAPEAAGVDVVAALHRHHQAHYAGEAISVAVSGRQPLQELEKWVTESFGGVPARKGAAPGAVHHAEANRLAFTSEQLGLWYRVAPMRELRRLEMMWQIPPVMDQWMQKPARYLCHLLGHEGEGSVLCVLRGMGWGQDLSAYVADEARGFAELMVAVDLTPEGMAHQEEVVGLVYAYVDLLRGAGPQRWVYEEIEATSRLKFDYRDREDPLPLVKGLAQRLHYYPPSHLLSGPALVHAWDPAAITAMLEELRPANMNAMVAAQEHAGDAMCKEPWYGCKYSVGPAPPPEAFAPPPGAAAKLSLPPRNPFLPSDLSLLPAPPGAAAGPMLLRDDEVARVWFQQEGRFQVPKAWVKLMLVSPAVYASPASFVAAELLVLLVEDALASTAYLAELAGVSYVLVAHPLGVSLTVRGFHSKLPELLAAVAARLADPLYPVERFKDMKSKFLQSLANGANNSSVQHAGARLAHVMMDPHWDRQQRAAAAEGVTQGDVEALVGALRGGMYVEALCVGNLTAESASGAVEGVLGAMRPGALPLSSRPTQQAIVLARRGLAPSEPSGCAYFHRILDPNPAGKDNAVVVALQVGPDDPELAALLDVFARVARKPCFAQLRTQEQLGYICQSGVSSTADALSWVVRVQSPTKDPAYVTERVAAFIDGFGEHLAGLTAAQHANVLESLRVAKLEPEKTLRKEAERRWREVARGSYMWDRETREAEALTRVSQEDLMEFYKTRITAKGGFRRMLCVQVQTRAEGGPASPPLGPSGTDIEGVAVIGGGEEDIAALKGGARRFGAIIKGTPPEAAGATAPSKL